MQKDITSGQRLFYTGKGFIGYDNKVREMVFIEWDGNDYRVKYKDFELNVRPTETIKAK